MWPETRHPNKQQRSFADDQWAQSDSTTATQKNLVFLLWIFTISLHEPPRLADLRQTGYLFSVRSGFVLFCVSLH